MRRLTTAWMGSSNPTAPASNSYVKKIDHNYDDDGNRTSVVTTAYQQTPQTTSYTTNNLNEYTAVGGTTQVSDANGNLTDNGTHLFLYDYKNHIVQVKLKSSGAVIASYRYDALGRRVEKNVGGTVERHVLSIANGPGDIEDPSNVVSIYDGSDVWKQNFVWSDEADGIQMLEQKDVLDYDTDGNTTEVTRSFYHRNALGSVMEITDMNQVVVVSYRYDPYGKVTITRSGAPQSSDPLGNHWLFTATFLDEESGLLYSRARCYDPATGRFLSRSPLGYSQGPHVFEYVATSPTNGPDPTGFDPGWYNDAPDAWDWFAWFWNSGRARGRGAPLPPPIPQPWWKTNGGGGVGVQQKKQRLERVMEKLWRLMRRHEIELRPPGPFTPYPSITAVAGGGPPQESRWVQGMRMRLQFLRVSLADAGRALNGPNEPTEDEIKELEEAAEYYWDRYLKDE